MTHVGHAAEEVHWTLDVCTERLHPVSLQSADPEK
jgi:hypothetical protein